MNHVAIVTGASSGFGLWTTIELAKHGFTVIATMRNIEKQKMFQSVTTDQTILNRINTWYLDVTDSESIDKFNTKFQTLERVDVLVNNAGIAIGGFAEELSTSDYQRQFETNVFGAIAVTQVVLPRMRAQRKGTIIHVSSISGRIGFPGLSPYVASKHALEGYSESLRLEMKPYDVQVALVEPGSFQTNIWTSGMEFVKGRGASPYHHYKQKLLSRVEAGKKKYGDPQIVARLICNIARMKKVNKLRYPIGRGVRGMFLTKQLLPWQWWEKIIIHVIRNGK
ncbi:SDR family oxidoreductase [Aquibacillus albus]|uniref:NAD(P)-dependent dehydrogenase (Short-subunit alcohol dehydrogenase family) n=1 Tax=Aquibacillus albus TaxID=1168171 RepID=A0ABS2MY03_9BACI|nr:SDR family oxidoreductase [Aquibacillus albus]MBM7570745.1 NAD(P)-dependent dehydrogenase (short-subunit alcohol dehydrogenase family) [Aquibacillus albus]